MFYNRIFIPGTSPCESERGAEELTDGVTGGGAQVCTGSEHSQSSTCTFSWNMLAYWKSANTPGP